MRRFKENFQSLTIDFKSVTVIVLDGDRAMSLRVDNSEWSFPFAMQLTFTEEFDSGVEQQDLVSLLKFFLLDSAVVPSLGPFFVKSGTVVSFLTLFF